MGTKIIVNNCNPPSMFLTENCAIQIKTIEKRIGVSKSSPTQSEVKHHKAYFHCRDNLITGLIMPFSEAKGDKSNLPFFNLVSLRN